MSDTDEYTLNYAGFTFGLNAAEAQRVLEAIEKIPSGASMTIRINGRTISRGGGRSVEVDNVLLFTAGIPIFVTGPIGMLPIRVGG
jgi:hypothetical protein